ncbi:MAG: hypothetical protein HC918_00485 [Oscillatoriales cyanobacterium SM2_1_8]|nr:hypothetical protein [Oscillatoriales cyanobacterium SM2_1_8]
MAKADHIYVHFTKFVHHGIDCGDGTVIHYDGERIVQTPVATFGGGNQLFVKRYGQHDPNDVVIRRAKSRVGESKIQSFF